MKTLRLLLAGAAEPLLPECPLVHGRPELCRQAECAKAVIAFSMSCSTSSGSGGV